MIQARETQQLIHTVSGSNASVGIDTRSSIIFYPTRQAARRTRLLAIIMSILSATGSVLLAAAAILYWPMYTHPFTPYLKWQDALLATLSYGSFILMIASITLVRYSLAARQGNRQGIFIFHTKQHVLTVRDLSPKNFHAIARMIGSSFTCFLVTLAGLAPCILIGWTLHLSHTVLLLLTTAIAIAISLVGFTVSLIFATFLVISLIGARALTRSLGHPHTYRLTHMTALRIDNNVLTITCPDRPETLFDLNLLHPGDQRHLLQLLQQQSIESVAQAQSFSVTEVLDAATTHMGG